MLSRTRLLVPMLIAAFASGCTGSNSNAPSQLAAKVNDDEITVSQVQAAVVRAKSSLSKDDQKLKNQVLSGLIERQLAVQQAKKQKLDRSPEFVGALGEMKLDLLAQLYTQQLLMQNRPSVVDIKKYYTDHPELFAERRSFQLVDLDVGSHATEAKAHLQEMMLRHSSFEEIVQWVTSQPQLAYSITAATRTPDLLPLAIVPRLGKAKPGDILEYDTPDNGFHLITIRDATPEPMSLDQASPAIQNFLTFDRIKSVAPKTISSLRDQAKIEYMNGYGALIPDANPSP